MMYLTTLKLNKEFKRIYYKAAYKAHPLVVTYLLKNNRSSGRYGITTSKKAGNAVRRNRARRLITAALTHLEKEFDFSKTDVVFVARADTSHASLDKLEDAMRKHLRALKLRAMNSEQ